MKWSILFRRSLAVVAGAGLAYAGRRLFWSAFRASSTQAGKAQVIILAALAQQGPDFLLLLDPAGTVRLASASVRRHLGRAPSDLMGQSLQALVPDEDKATVGAALSQLRDGGSGDWRLKLRLQDSGGAWLWLEARGQNCLADPELAGLVLSLRPAGQALTTAHPDWLARLDTEGTVRQIQAPHDHPWAADAHRLVGHRLATFLPAGAARALEQMIQQALATGQEQQGHHSLNFAGLTRHFEVRIIRLGEVEVLLLARDRPRSRTPARQEAILHAVSFAAERLLQTTSWEAALDEVLANLGQATGASRVWLHRHERGDDETLLLAERYDWVAPEANGVGQGWPTPPAAYAEIGLGRWARELDQGRPIQGRVADLPTQEQAFLRTQGVGSLMVIPVLVGSSGWGALGLDDIDASRRWSEIDGNGLGAAAGMLGAAIWRQEADAIIHRRQKLESVGVLAGGVAHDFNNLLTGMMAQTSLALTRLSPNHPARSHVEKSALSTQRAAELTRQLLAYAGRAESQVESLDLNGLIRQNVALLETTLPPQAVLKLALAPDLPAFAGDPGQVQQVIMNLVINGAEAIGPQGGELRIQTRRLFLHDDERYQAMADRPEDEFVCLIVHDTGRGMTRDTLNRAFDPFFSTKSSGHGLGLSATLGIVEKHRGLIDVQSELGQGSTFRVFFPASPALQPARHPAPAGGLLQGLVLVIDDEAAVREAVSDILAVAGMETVTAADGPSGLEIYQRLGSSIALVLLDMRMPNMGGEETFRRLRKLNPEVKVILSSGFGQAEVRDRLEAEGVAAFLNKPYDMAELIQTVRTALKATREA